MSVKFMVEVSARHLHLSQADLETLFGPDAKLTPKKDLSQPGQYACEERVDVVGPKGTIPRVSVLGPTRPATQVEVSLTDARALGVEVPIRESGDIAGSAGCKLVGPAGEVELKEGLIAAKRHVHCDPQGAKELGVSDKEIVGVKIATRDRTLVFGDVVIRVSDKFCNAMHIDTDEANAAGASGDISGEIYKL